LVETSRLGLLVAALCPNLVCIRVLLEEDVSRLLRRRGASRPTSSLRPAQLGLDTTHAAVLLRHLQREARIRTQRTSPIVGLVAADLIEARSSHLGHLPAVHDAPCVTDQI
jgi:hypothetical protein